MRKQGQAEKAAPWIDNLVGRYAKPKRLNQSFWAAERAQKKLRVLGISQCDGQAAWIRVEGERLASFWPLETYQYAMLRGIGKEAGGFPFTIQVWAHGPFGGQIPSSLNFFRVTKEHEQVGGVNPSKEDSDEP